MPINEFTNPSSNLSNQQESEALASIYTSPQTPGSMNVTLTPEEYRVLQMLQAKAGNLMEQPIREFDLNKPPVAPYHYQEFPYMLYHHQTRRTILARNHGERQSLIDDGWSIRPFPAEIVELELSALEAAEAEALNKIAKQKRKP